MSPARHTTCWVSNDGHLFVTEPWSPNLAKRTSNDGTTQGELRSELLEEQAIESDPAEGYDALCEFCESLNIANLETFYGPEGQSLNLDLLIEAASCCKTCERIFNLRTPRFHRRAIQQQCTRELQNTSSRRWMLWHPSHRSCRPYPSPGDARNSHCRVYCIHK
jgi:hypothetical protein